MQGGTNFTFVTGGIESALDQAREAAGADDVAIAGGASTVQQYLAAGLLDELYLHIVPLLGDRRGHLSSQPSVPSNPSGGPIVAASGPNRSMYCRLTSGQAAISARAA